MMNALPIASLLLGMTSDINDILPSNAMRISNSGLRSPYGNRVYVLLIVSIPHNSKFENGSNE
jgi:hypothetical protein